MSGKYNSAQAAISRLLDREVPYIPCQGHRSNTVNEHSGEASPIVLYLSYLKLSKRHILFSLTVLSGMLSYMRSFKMLRTR